jgi:short subunit dehydrogenase-like uncharacterized protein
MTAPNRLIRLMKLSNYLKPILSAHWLKTLLKKRIDRQPPGPGLEELENGNALIWGRAENRGGESKEIVIETAEGYRLTAETAWLIAEKVMNENIMPGYQTPTMVYGPDLVFELKKTKWIVHP